jgi:NADH-quinone oxidoreductase subunit K
MTVPFEHTLALAMFLFFAGMAGIVSWRGNLIMMLVAVEIMLNAVMLVFVSGAARWGDAGGQVFALMIMALTAAEVSIALALVVLIHRRRQSLDTDRLNRMKG